MFVFLCVMFSAFECAACNSLMDPGLFRVSLFISEQCLFFLFKFSDQNEYDHLQLYKICLLFQSSVGQPATTWLRPSVSEPEAETPGTDPDTMRTGEILTLPCREAKRMFSFLSCFDCDFFFFVAFADCFTFFVLSILLQIKPWSELPRLLQGYFCFAILSLLALLGLTVFSLYKQHTDTDVSDEDNFTVSLIQLVGIGEFVESKEKKRHLQRSSPPPPPPFKKQKFFCCNHMMKTSVEGAGSSG